MAKTFDLSIIIKAIDKLSTPLNKMSGKLKKFSDKTQKVGKSMKELGGKMSTFVTLPILAAGAAMIKSASDMEESINKVNVAFKNSADGVIEWSKTTLENFGIAQGTALDMAALFGDMGTSMGVPTEKAADMSKKLVGLAGDLASFKNIRVDIAQTALAGVYTGETESLKKLGVVMTQVNLQEFALSKGIKTDIKDMTQREKVMLRYNFILNATKNAQGDFKNTSSGAANQMRIFSETLKELASTFGAIILPIFTKIVTKLVKVLNWFNKLSTGTKRTILVFLGIAAAIGPLIISIGSLITAISAISKALAFLVAHPIILIIAGIIAAIIALIWVIKNWDKVVRALNKAWKAVVEFIKRAAVAIVKFVKDMVDKAFKLFDKFSGIGLLIAAPFTIVLSIIKSVVEHLDEIKAAFTEGGMVEGIKAIGKAILDGILVPIQSLFGILSNLPGVGKTFKGAQVKVQNVRENLFNKDNLTTNSKSESEIVVKLQADTGTSATIDKVSTRGNDTSVRVTNDMQLGRNPR